MMLRRQRSLDGGWTWFRVHLGFRVQKTWLNALGGKEDGVGSLTRETPI